MNRDEFEMSFEATTDPAAWDAVASPPATEEVLVLKEGKLKEVANEQTAKEET